MATGMVENWVNVDVMGPIYPFVGSEGLLTLIGIALWVVWHIWQIRTESTGFNDDLSNIKGRGGVGAVLDEEKKRETSDLSGG